MKSCLLFLQNNSCHQMIHLFYHGNTFFKRETCPRPVFKARGCIRDAEDQDGQLKIEMGNLIRVGFIVDISI